jgi:hypothetical protein
LFSFDAADNFVDTVGINLGGLVVYHIGYQISRTPAMPIEDTQLVQLAIAQVNISCGIQISG